MNYCITMSIILVFTISLSLYMFYFKHYKEMLSAGLFILFICTIPLTGFIIDIPNILSGGEKIYVDQFPQIIYGRAIHLMFVDDYSFTSYKSFNPDKYDPNGKYCITYTKFTKNILDIEQVYY